MDVFWKGDDGYLWDTYWTGTAWADAKISQWQISSTPAPLAGAADLRMDVFWTDSIGALWDSWWVADPGWQDSKIPLARWAPLRRHFPDLRKDGPTCSG